MPHRTTVVELSIAPKNFFSIVQSWANENEFSLYEKSEGRTIYFKKMWGAKAWLAVENHGGNAKLEAWLSSKSVGPEFSGNIWVGWKMQLPQGFSYGIPLTYKTQFKTLLGRLESESTSVLHQNIIQTSLNKSLINKSLMAFGVFSFLAGSVSLLSATSLIKNSWFPSLASDLLADGVSEMVFGAFLFASSRALNKGKLLGLWLYAAGILSSIVYKVLIGQSFNYLFLGFSMLILWQMYKSKDAWELS